MLIFKFNIQVCFDFFLEPLIIYRRIILSSSTCRFLFGYSDHLQKPYQDTYSIITPICCCGQEHTFCEILLQKKNITWFAFLALSFQLQLFFGNRRLFYGWVCSIGKSYVKQEETLWYTKRKNNIFSKSFTSLEVKKFIITFTELTPLNLLDDRSMYIASHLPRAT